LSTERQHKAFGVEEREAGSAVEKGSFRKARSLILVFAIVLVVNYMYSSPVLFELTVSVLIYLYMTRTLLSEA